MADILPAALALAHVARYNKRKGFVGEKARGSPSLAGMRPVLPDHEKPPVRWCKILVWI